MSQPATRDLNEIIRAAEVIAAELDFQAGRLEQRVQPLTDNEKEHLDDLKRGYRDAAKYVRILMRYQEGRRDRGRMEMRSDDGAIERDGRSRGYTEE